jgi:hypothetical protein
MFIVWLLFFMCVEFKSNVSKEQCLAGAALPNGPMPRMITYSAPAWIELEARQLYPNQNLKKRKVWLDSKESLLLL